MADDDLLSPDEIEALLNASGSGASSDKTQDKEPATTPPASSAELNIVGANEIEAMLNAAGAGAPSANPVGAEAKPAGSSATEQLLDSAEANLAAAVSPTLSPGIPPELGDPAPFQFETFEQPESHSQQDAVLGTLQDVELDVRIELGRAELLIEEVLKLKDGSVVPLDKLAGDPVDILVNGRLVARGEVLVLNDNFCVRVAEILTPEF